MYIYRWENQCTERLSNLSTVTQLVLVKPTFKSKQSGSRATDLNHDITVQYIRVLQLVDTWSFESRPYRAQKKHALCWFWHVDDIGLSHTFTLFLSGLWDLREKRENDGYRITELEGSQKSASSPTPSFCS